MFEIDCLFHIIHTCILLKKFYEHYVNYDSEGIQRDFDGLGGMGPLGDRLGFGRRGWLELGFYRGETIIRMRRGSVSTRWIQ